MSTQITPDVRSLADTFKEGISDVATGSAKSAEGLYETTLPDGLTKEIYLSFASHNTNVAAASMLALGEMATNAMAADKALEKVTLDLPTFGKDKFSLSFERSKEVVIPSQDGVTGTKTTFGRAQVSFDQYGLGKRGQVQAVKSLLADKAKEALGY